jgi:DNA-binding HxlR family transcriptional regulator
VNWQNLMDKLAPLRTVWDTAVIVNLAAGIERPGDLIEAINAQAPDDRQIGWKVLIDALRRLERTGYVARREMPSVPRETRYWLTPPGQRLVSALIQLDAWYPAREPGEQGTDGQAAGDCDSALTEIAPDEPDGGTDVTRRHGNPVLRRWHGFARVMRQHPAGRRA